MSRFNCWSTNWCQVLKEEETIFKLHCPLQPVWRKTASTETETLHTETSVLSTCPTRFQQISRVIASTCGILSLGLIKAFRRGQRTSLHRQAQDVRPLEACAHPAARRRDCLQQPCRTHPHSHQEPLTGPSADDGSLTGTHHLQRSSHCCVAGVDPRSRDEAT